TRCTRRCCRQPLPGPGWPGAASSPAGWTPRCWHHPGAKPWSWRRWYCLRIPAMRPPGARSRPWHRCCDPCRSRCRSRCSWSTPGLSDAASRRCLSEFGRAGQPVEAEHSPRVAAYFVGAIDETGIAALGKDLVVRLLLFQEAALAEQFVDGHRDVAAGLAHHQHALALEEQAQVDYRQQVAADVGHAEHPGLRARHRRELRQRQDLDHFVEARGQQPRTDAIADAAPEAWRIELLGQADHVRQAAPFE